MTRILAAAPLLLAGVVVPTGSGAGTAEPAALELVQTIPLKGEPGRLDHLALDAKGQRLFVANLSNNSLDVVDLRAGRLVKQLPGQRKIQGVAYVPDPDRVFVGNGADGECRAFDGKTYRQLGAVKLPDADNVRYDPAAGLVWVGHAEKAISAIDPRTLDVKAAVKLPGAPEAFQIDPERKRLYVNCLGPATVAVVDTEKGEVVARHPLTLADRNYPLALDREGGRLFVGCRQKPTVVVLDAKTGKEAGGAEIPGEIDDLFFDARRGRLYAACGEGFLAVLRQAGGRFEIAEKVPVPKLTRTCLFDPESGRLFVPVPRQEGKDGPELRVYQARP